MTENRRSRVSPWLLIDGPLGWTRRGRLAELIAEADTIVADALHERDRARYERDLVEQGRSALDVEVLRLRHEVAEAEHRAAVAVYERARLRNRRSIRLLTAVVDTAGEKSVRSLPRRIVRALRAGRALQEPGPPPEPPELPEAPPPPEPPEEREAPRPVRAAADDYEERALLPPRPQRAVPFPHLRILHLGAAGRFVGLAPHTAVDPDTWREQLREGADLMLIEPLADAPEWDPLDGELPTLLRAASELGVPSVRLTAPGVVGGPGEAELELTEDVPDDIGDRLVPSVDTGHFNPQGWRQQPADPVLAVLARAPDGAGRALLAGFDPPVTTARAPDLRLDDPVGTDRRLATPAAVRRSLNRAGVLLDHPGWRDEPAETLRLWAAALACGTPVVTIAPDPVMPDVPGVIRVEEADAVELVHTLLTTPDLRERHSIVGRRHALGDLDRESALRRLCGAVDVPLPPPLRTTVLLATHRPDFLARGLDSVARQTRAGVDVSLVLHGVAFDEVDVPTTDAELGAVTRAPGHWTLGDCLNAGLDRADGELVAKMDDDDHYGPGHLTDLVQAWHHSGADLVGKRVEFVHLVDLDLTLRRRPSRTERDRPHVGGPTPLGSRELLRRHRFLRRPNRVDSTLYERVLADGGRIYGIHSRDLVLERHGRSHAWATEDDEFLEDAVDQRPGLDLDFASSDPATAS